jgi:hypothetical protein
MIFDYINDRTGFADGDLFENDKELKAYFTVGNVKAKLGADYEITQAELDEMVGLVISNKWHLKKEKSRVFSVRISQNATQEATKDKLKELVKRIKEFQS